MEVQLSLLHLLFEDDRAGAASHAAGLDSDRVCIREKKKEKRRKRKEKKKCPRTKGEDGIIGAAKCEVSVTTIKKKKNNKSALPIFAAIINFY